MTPSRCVFLIIKTHNIKDYILIQSLILLLYSNTIFDGSIPFFRDNSYHSLINILHLSLLEEASPLVNLFMNCSLPDDG